MKDLGSLKLLETLDLADTHVTDAGLSELGGLESLYKLNLGTLVLEDTNVTDKGLKALVKLKKLHTLDLSGRVVALSAFEGAEVPSHAKPFSGKLF